jgi:Family of unknown function (DUF5996)
MQSSGWRDLRGVDPKLLGEARLQAHYAAQWLARTARAYIPSQTDDSHTNLGWRDAINGFETHHLRDGSRLGLNIADLALVFSGAGEGAKRTALSLHGREDAQVRLWVAEQITAKGLNPNLLDHASPYAMPPHAIAGGAPYAGPELGEAFGELAAWFADAEIALEGVRKQIVARDLPAPSPRCWPHHFDLATLTSFSAGDSGGAAFVGAGFSPGDHYYDEPYFYVSLYPAPDVATLPALPDIGHWHSHEFTAAVTPASKILTAPDRQAAIAEFLAFSVDAAISALAGRGI